MSKPEVEGLFDQLSEAQKSEVRVLLARYHYRDAVRFPDGSIGTVRITLKELGDLLAYTLLNQARR